MARPDRLDETRAEEILRYLRAGNYIETACALAGIHPSTYYRWIERGNDPKAPAKFREFREAATRARAEAEARNVAIVQRAAGTDWRAATWYLERSFPTRYGRRDRIEHSGPEGGPISLQGLAQMLGVDDEAGEGAE